MLVSLSAFAQEMRLHREICIACINMLQVSQKILKRIFPNDGTVWVEAVGDILRIMFECSLQHTSDFCSENFVSIQFKVHASLPQFLEFCKSFAIFLHHSRIDVHGTDFLVMAIHEPRRERRFFCKDESRFYEFVIFEVEFFCRDTKRTFKFQFSCDAGYYFPEPNFGVNCLTFSGRHGFRVKSPADSCSVLEILRCIIDGKADWHEPMNPHISILGIILSLQDTRRYKLFGIPFFEEAECPISLERET